MALPPDRKVTTVFVIVSDAVKLRVMISPALANVVVLLLEAMVTLLSVPW